MEQLKTIAGGIVMMLLVSLACLGQQPSIKNTDIITMVHAGLGTPVIIEKIHHSPADFDTSPDALAELKKDGVSDAVIMAMVDHHNSSNAASNPPATAAVQHASVPLKGARIYIAPMNGFETYLTAAFEKKHVPMMVVASKEAADYILEGASQSQKAGWAKMLIMGSVRSAETASIRLISPVDGQVVWAYSVNKANSYHGEQSTAEACAKHLAKFIRERDRHAE